MTTTRQKQGVWVRWWATAALWLVTAASQAAGLAATPVAPNIYTFIGDLGGRTAENGGMNANAGFVVTGEGVVVIDSGSGNHVARDIDAFHRLLIEFLARIKGVANTRTLIALNRVKETTALPIA